MSNVIDQLAGLGVSDEHPAPADIVRSDLLRGRAAQRRRRFRRGVTGLGATAAVAVAAVAFTAAQPAPAPAPGPASTGLNLVAYTGTQLPGFTVGKVPEGFVLQGSNSYSLDIAQPGDKTPLQAYEGKLVVLLQSKDQGPLPAGKAVEVNGRPGTISKFDPTAAQLFYSDGSHKIVIQAATKLGLTDEELVEFATSVTVTAKAQAGVG
jgi:hypothetical protein